VSYIVVEKRISRPKINRLSCKRLL